MSKINLVFPALLIVLCFACGSDKKKSMCDDAGAVGGTNPSTLYCEALGYGQEQRTSPEGVHSVCIFTDGTECSTWDFFRGQCGLDWTECARRGYPTGNAYCDVSMTRHVTCTTPDGSTCFDWDLAVGRCGGT